MHATAKAEDRSEEKAEKADKKPKSDQDYATAIATIASGIKTLTEAGVGGQEASRLAFAIWERCYGK